MRVLTIALLRCQGLETRPFSHGSAKIPPKPDCLNKLSHRNTSATKKPLPRLDIKLESRKPDRDLASNLSLPLRKSRPRHASTGATACQGINRLVSGPRQSPSPGSASSQLPYAEPAYPDPSRQEATCQDGSYQNSSTPQQFQEEPAITPAIHSRGPPIIPPPPITLICKCCEREYYQHVHECTICYGHYFWTLREYNRMVIREKEAIVREEVKLKGWSAKGYLLVAYFYGGFCRISGYQDI